VTINDGANLSRLTGYVKGPKDSPYEGGVFTVDITLEGSYPFVPPKMRFITKAGQGTDTVTQCLGAPGREEEPLA
jgi:ubiquitin-protein ligase